jgi:hypothetical protein
MTKLLDRAIEGVRQLPEQEQDDLAGFLLAHLAAWEATPDESVTGLNLTDEDRAAIAEADQEFARGDVVSGEELQAFWKKLGQ